MSTSPDPDISERSNLVRLASEIAMRKNMPAPDDWPWPNRVSQKLYRAAHDQCTTARDQCGIWATALMAIADGLTADKTLSSDLVTVDPKAPNADGKTLCEVRWLVETPGGWLGAWDRGAFSAFARAIQAEERDRCAANVIRSRCK